MMSLYVRTFLWPCQYNSYGAPKLLLSGELAPLDLPPLLLLLGLRLHLLHVHRVRLPSPHEQVVVADAEVEDQLVHPQLLGVKREVGVAPVDRLDRELLVVETDVPDFWNEKLDE